MISTQEEWRQPGTGTWLGGAEERLLLETKALHTKKNVSKPNISIPKKNLSTKSFQQSYQTISFEVKYTTSINQALHNK